MNLKETGNHAGLFFTFFVDYLFLCVYNVVVRKFQPQGKEMPLSNFIHDCDHPRVPHEARGFEEKMIEAAKSFAEAHKDSLGRAVLRMIHQFLMEDELAMAA